MKAGRESGFTLLEVLVALAVMSVGAALTMSLISGALANIRKVQLRTRTIQHAETVMELTLLDDSIKRSTTLQGDFEDGTRWSVEVLELEAPSPLPSSQKPPELPVKLFSYTVAVMSPESRMPDFRLQTVKVVNVVEPLKPQGLPR